MEIRRRLSEANPARYEPDLALSFGARAAVLSRLNRLEEAAEAIREGIELIKPYASQWPDSRHGRLLEVLETLEADLALAVSQHDTKPVKGERNWRRILRILGGTGS